MARTDGLADTRGLSRRSVMMAGGGTIALLGGPLSALAQRRGPAEVPVDELMKAGDLPDLAIGKPDAKVTIVEYASMTCGHCAAFHNTVLPELKKKYIDSGQVRLIFRDFPLDNLAAAGSMLARCAGPEKAPTVIETLFKQQDAWVVRTNPVPKLFETVKESGFTQDSFDKCIKDQAMLDKIIAGRSRAAEKFGVSSTPTFFINGKRYTGTLSVAEFDKVLEPLLKG